MRQNFHICLCMSPVGNDLRVRCRQFPSLVNCCTLDWFSKWPPEALLYVSQQKLINMELPSEEIREELAKMCMLIHTSVEEAAERFYSELRRRVYTTPKRRCLGFACLSPRRGPVFAPVAPKALYWLLLRGGAAR